MQSARGQGGKKGGANSGWNKGWQIRNRMMGIEVNEDDGVFGRCSYLWMLQEGKANGSCYMEGVCYCLNNYAYDSSREGFLGEGSFFRTFRARKLFSFKKDSFEEVLRTLKIGLISCLRSHKVLLSKGESFKVVLSVYERVILEFLIMNRLSHRSIPKVFELLEIPEVNQLVVVQEHLPFQLMYWEGSSQVYSALGDSKVPLVYGERASLIILSHLVACLEYIHEQGIVHRDIKPENIFLTRKAQDSDLLIADYFLCSDQDPWDDSESASECSDGGFEERFAWSDSPVHKSVLDAKIKQERLFRDVLKLNRASQMERFIKEEAGRLCSLGQVLILDEYRDFFQKSPDPFHQGETEPLIKLSDFNSAVVVDDSRLIFDSGKCLLCFQLLLKRLRFFKKKIPELC